MKKPKKNFKKDIGGEACRPPSPAGLGTTWTYTYTDLICARILH